jgi:DNA-directed RNA polymerase subunit E'/Rpb7
METIALFEEKIPITPRDLSRGSVKIEGLLSDKLSQKLEGRCSLHGYVIPGTMKLLSRSVGYIEKGRNTGDIVYHIQAEGNVIYPPDGTVLQGEILRKNKMGMFVNYKDAIHVILPRDLHIGNEEFDGLQIGEVVKVEIKKSRFQVNDEYILSVGVYLGKTIAAPSVQQQSMAPAAAAVAESEENNESDEEEEGKE